MKINYLTADPPQVTAIESSDNEPYYIDSTIELICIVSGVDPADNITWTSSNGTQVYFTDETDGANVTVTISVRSDYGEYRCTATNDYGNGVAMIIISMPGM